ncbi:MAG: phosphonoacetaldehyde hydrolase [Armatimonadota bacterium]|nr:phosphonoacetaldehyde hydrolase [Armatimonadota bacterium]
MPFAYRREYRGPIRLVAFDWAGTIVDFGCQAPALAFVELFDQEGVEVTVEQARGPMGIDKREHIAALLDHPEIARAWEDEHGSEPTTAAGDRLFEELHEIQVDMALECAELIPGVLEVVDWLRGRGARIATNTGYFQAVLDALLPAVEEQGFEADSNVCATRVPEARPAPWMLVVNMLETGVYPPAAVVKVGDTVPDIEEGLNAGAWAVGVVESGSGVGMTQEQIEDLPDEVLAELAEDARWTLLRAGAHYTIPTVADLPPVIEQVEERLGRGERP